ncbi:FKBP12-associated protein [Allomyces javanicus]|nr:FKBP12-associated protein [Allomyces javanicus]
MPGIDADLRAALEVMHECARACGKPLPCGTHTCAFPCHPGACPTCLESSFDDLVCHCGRSVIRAPVPCGTTHAPCSFPCIRTRECGHPTVSFHACHPDSVPCPPCAVLVQRACRCTGTALPVPCHRADVPACGERCARTMPCGHRCAKVCHAATDEQARESGAPVSDCECRDACGMRRAKSCGHACTAPCHPANVACEDAGPCGVMVRRACACGRRSEVGACKVGQNAVPVACDEACAVVARNKRLAAALLTSASSSSRSSLHPDDDEPDEDDRGETYPSDLLSLAARDLALVRDVEAAWSELITQAATNATLVATRFFPPMKAPKRALLHAYAPFWGLTAASHDPEPARCVAVTARHGVSRAPRVSLSAAVVAGPAPTASAVPAVAAQAVVAKRAAVPVLANALVVERTPLARHADLAPYLRLFFGSARVAGVSTTPCGEGGLVDAVVRAEGVAPVELDALVRDRIVPALAALLVDLGKAAAVKAARVEGGEVVAVVESEGEGGGWRKMVGKGKGKPRLARTGSAASGSGNAFAVLDPDAQEPVVKVEEEEEVKVRGEEDVPTRWDEDEDEDEDEEARSTDVVADEDAGRVAHPEDEEHGVTPAHDAVEVSEDGLGVDAPATTDVVQVTRDDDDDDDDE